MTALAILAVAGAERAAAHQVDPSVLTVIDDVEPAVDGLRVEVGTSVTTQLLVANDTGEVLEVRDDADQPFLRVGPDGVEANLAAPAWYLTNLPFGGEVPPGAGPDEPPRWVRVSTERSWGWFDHRLHPTVVGEVLEESAAPTFEVPMRLGDRELVVRGHLEARTTVPRFASALRSVPPAEKQLLVQLLEGRAPGLFVRYHGDGEVVVLGADDEPFVRLSARGTEVNRASPTWLFSAQARGEDITGVVTDPRAEPQWQVVASSRSYAWLDPRALIDDAGEETVTRDWVVPVLVDGRRVQVAGTSTATVTPIAELTGGAEDDEDRQWLVAGVAVAAAATVGVVVRLGIARRRAGA